jgi:hypothetical protein
MKHFKTGRRFCLIPAPVYGLLLNVVRACTRVGEFAGKDALNSELSGS